MKKERKLNFELLLSCINQKDFSIIERSRIQSDVLIVNQYCSIKKEEKLPYLETQEIGGFFCRKYNVQEKGISRSRNFAIRNAQADICLLADDDEEFCSQYREMILSSFERYPYADILIFRIGNRPKKVRTTFHPVYFPEILRVSSCQIAFRRKRVIEKKIVFDEDMGAGTGNGAEEEIKFLLECLKQKLKIFNVPVTIAMMQENNHSTWFYGYNEVFFENRGMTTRYLFGTSFALGYGIYYIWTKRELYQDDISAKQAWNALRRGIKQNRLGKKKRKEKRIKRRKRKWE